ncbi:mechanosensitive ion channel domain-containing protein [Palleronia caenipelagi]|uniref:Mechanosensitive ion channel n=1 Tax=Palleronia caenipelagi TaxID=2489174 RepID=A0A547Q2S4_9RHOB|nr:mechanosensitive ion channel domain-containing protein [Palleronia caenipelagi]TRD20686.1 mechanosensitive ion channel [Palleronia caenipelagi]
MTLRQILSPLALALVALFTLVTASLAQDTGAAGDATGKSDVELLIDVISDDQKRTDLLERLKAGEAAQSETETSDSATASSGETASEDPGTEADAIGRQLAQATQQVAQDIAGSMRRFWNALMRLPQRIGSLGDISLPTLLSAFSGLALIIVSTVIVYWLLRRVAKPIYRNVGHTAREAGWMRSFVLWLATGVLDLMTVLVAWAVGYGIATLAIGEAGQISLRQSMYLNAFLVVGAVRVGLRMILSPGANELRVLPMSQKTARRLTRWLSLIIGFVGYGAMLVVPIVRSEVSYAAGSSLITLIALTAIALFAVLVLRYQTRFGDWMTGENGIIGGQGALHWLARRWHWPVLIYLFLLAGIILVSPSWLVFKSLQNSGEVLLVVLAGIALSTLISRAMARGISLPEDVNARFPMMERRLNSFVPKLLMILRALIAIVVVVVALGAINVINPSDWIGATFMGRLVTVIVILTIAFVIWLTLTSYVDYRLNPFYGSVPSARERTLFALGRNAANIALVVLTLMFVLAEIGINIAPLLASAGVLGLAIGFGAQKLVQDIITGVFIQLERAMNVGDVVTVGGTTGTVERLTIRSVSLRDVSGVYHIIPFSSVDLVSNFVRDFSYYLCDMGVAYREDVSEVKAAMEDAFAVLNGDPDYADNIIGEFEWFGVQELADSAVILRVRIKCAPGTQWTVGRRYMEICKRIFDARDIEIPFPHQTLTMAQSKSGETETLNIVSHEKHRTAPPQSQDQTSADAPEQRSEHVLDQPPDDGGET